MSLALLFHYLLLNVFRMLVHLSSEACDLLWIYFMCCIVLVRCVTAQHVSNVSTSIFRSLRLTVKLTVKYTTTVRILSCRTVFILMSRSLQN